jgi:hypothetical protein
MGFEDLELIDDIGSAAMWVPEGRQLTAVLAGYEIHITDMTGQESAELTLSRHAHSSRRRWRGSTEERRNAAGKAEPADLLASVLDVLSPEECPGWDSNPQAVAGSGF